VALAALEAWRLVRSPLVWLGVLLTVAFYWETGRNPVDWSGARYQGTPAMVGPLLATISFAVAGSFHRERALIGTDAPVVEATRAVGRLIGALGTVLIMVVLTAAGAVAVRMSGGFDLGDEPGRTLHAHYSWAELLQLPVLAVFAVALGAAAGRRLRHRASATLALFVGWFPVSFAFWAFQSRHTVPFSIIQTQPVSVPIGPIETDPQTFPEKWLLLVPGEYQDHWARAFVSAELAAWHSVWLLGLALLFVALALPRAARRLPLSAGLALAVVGVAMQYGVLP